MVAALALAGALPYAGRAAEGGRFPLVKAIPTVFDEKGAALDPASYPLRLTAIDQRRREVVSFLPYWNKVVLFNADSLRQIAVFDMGFVTGNTTATSYDAEGHRLFVSTGQCPSGNTTCSAVPNLHVVDVGRRQPGPTFTFPAAFQGLNVVALAFARTGERETLYAILHISEPLTNGVVHTTRLVALDVNRLASSDAVLWSYDVSPSCPDFPLGGGTMPYLGLARTGDFLYFACKGLVRPPSQQATHHSALVVDLGQPDPAYQDPARFRTDVSAFAGNVSLGFTGGDRAAERLFVVMAGGFNNRLATFDPRHRAWTGSVPFSGTNNVWGVTSDPAGTGRTWVIFEGRNLLVTDDLAVPQAQGQEYELDLAPGSAGPPLYDPATRRLFVPGPRFTENDSAHGTGATHLTALRVYRDDAPRSPRAAAPDPDAGTDDIEEVPGRTPVAFSGGASAYGARLDLVGGLKGLPGAGETVAAVNSLSAEFAVVSGLAASFDVPVPSPPQVSGNDRVYTMGWVRTTQVTPSATSAEAVGAAYDESTSAELANFGAGDAAREQTPETQPSQCSDTEDRSTRMTRPGSASECDLDGQRATANAAQDREAAAGGPRIVSGSSRTNVVRGRNGTVAFAEAFARDVDLPMPDGGTLHIDSVSNTAETRAHGRTGTARATLSTAIRGATITDGAGRTVYSCDECDPQALADAITARNPDRIGAVVPQRMAGAEAATPKGAQALVLKDPFQYWSDFTVNNDSGKEVAALEVTYYDDADEPSRLVVQLAGVLAESHFTVALGDGDAPTTLGSLDGGGPDGSGIGGGGGSLPGGGAAGGPGGRSGRGGRRPLYLIPVRAIGGLLLHGPGQAVLFVLVWLLLGTPLWLAARRRALVLVESPETYA